MTLFNDLFVENAERYDLSQTGPLLDQFGETITDVRVFGETSTQDASKTVASRTIQDSASIGATLRTVDLQVDEKLTASQENERSGSVTRQGREVHYVHFGATRRTWERMIDTVAPNRIWVFLDEWSSVPIDLQPYLADLVRRSIFPVRNVIVKIAAIEQRSAFSLSQDGGNYIGIEVGADAAADVNLDDFMVFDNDSTRARSFYRSLFFKHIKSTDVFQSANLRITSETDFVRTAFTQINTFDELVRASEGVPRDAINIVIQAAQYSGDSAIAVEDIRRAAHAWYQRDKESVVRSNENAAKLLHWIVTEVIGGRRARAFLLRSDVRDPLIESLFDSRVLHILKRNISTRDEPGVRYHVYKLDYGCYVDLISTVRAPLGLLATDNADDKGAARFIDVPPDDYRAIRRAILRVDDFYEQADSLTSG